MPSIGPIVHGFLAFGRGLQIHKPTGFSVGGAVVLAVIAACSSDISGPPMLQAGMPSAAPSAQIGTSTAIGSPVAIAIRIPLLIGIAEMMIGRQDPINTNHPEATAMRQEAWEAAIIAE